MREPRDPLLKVVSVTIQSPKIILKQRLQIMKEDFKSFFLFLKKKKKKNSVYILMDAQW
jgi:hypothetical protein